MSLDEAFSLRGVRFARGGFTLDVPALSAPRGGVIGLVGRNGAGKSTLIGLLHGLLRPDAGQVSTLGGDPFRDPVGVRRQVGYMTDDLLLFPLRISQLFGALAPYYPTWDDRRVDELARRFELNTDRAVGDLSKGEGTRLRLVVALAHRPSLVLLDEPATDLDLGSRRRLMQTVLEVAADDQSTVLFSSHQLDDVERIADRVIVLEGGRVVRDGPTDTLVGEGRTLEDALIHWGLA